MFQSCGHDNRYVLFLCLFVGLVLIITIQIAIMTSIRFTETHAVLEIPIKIWEDSSCEEFCPFCGRLYVDEEEEDCETDEELETASQQTDVHGNAPIAFLSTPTGYEAIFQSPTSPKDLH